MPNTEPKKAHTSKGKQVHVAVGVILGEDQQILIARRADQAHQGGLWEFPGGKVEPGESVQSALDRELREELDISISSCSQLLEVAHDYGDKQVLLDVWWVKRFNGEPRGREGQPLRWVSVSSLVDYAFPAANQPIIAAISQAFSSDT